jgi:hypothetical protein
MIPHMNCQGNHLTGTSGRRPPKGYFDHKAIFTILFSLNGEIILAACDDRHTPTGLRIVQVVEQSFRLFYFL